MNPVAEDILMHYGMPRRSGRYPWGSGDNPYQHEDDFLSRVDQMRAEKFEFTDKNGKTWTGDTAIAKSLNLSTSQFRVQVALANQERRAHEVARAKALRADGKSLSEIAKEMGYNSDSSIRALLNENTAYRMNQAQATADIIRKHIKEQGMIDVGAGIEQELGVSREKLEQALYILQLEGYPVYGGGVPTGPGHQTNMKVICPPGTPHKDIYDYKNIHTITDYASRDGGETFAKLEYPSSMDSKRMKIRYAEDGGVDKDGVIELRRGVPDLSLGDSRYSQVRILVDGTHYLKGMAVYSDNMPDGVDLIFNTNKKAGTPALGPKDNTVLKPIKDDPTNPFGSYIPITGQSRYLDKDGKSQLSLINKRGDEGDWGEWKDKLPSQFLSKQSIDLMRKQLNLASANKQEEFDEIMSLTNPTIKRKLLYSFADDCDSAAVHLQAAALPRQKYRVILPIPSLKDTEVYAPGYRDGETVALIRYPHGGTFEIPILKVNNKNQEGIDILGKTPKDAIGITKKVADRLSGADFDGDTVMVIPCNSLHSKVKIKSTDPNSDEHLKKLADFDPKLEYGGKPEGSYRRMTKGGTQTEMGKISNLITDMTLIGATNEELARAVKHSMVVIDAEKHGLDYKQSEIDNNIKALKQKYQGHYDEDGRYHEGAATLISQAKSQQEVLKRKGSPIIDPETGKKSYKEVREEYIDKNGKKKLRTQKSTKMAEADDARELISTYKTPQEEIYAQYANHMKALGNRARKEAMATGTLKYSPSAKEIYKDEAASLESKLRLALLNAPRERQAQILANSEVQAKKKANPDMTKKEAKKHKQMALEAARIKVGAQRTPVEITPREWEAIQAGAISDNRLSKILDHTDTDKIKQYATPRSSKGPSQAKINMMQSMKAAGYTLQEIADRTGFSVSTVANNL